MSAAYRDALTWLYSLTPRGMRLELERMGRALADAGNPERRGLIVHIAGTNGKGSVSAMVERGLRAAGYRTGLFTSPHLHSFRERIRIDGVPIDEDEATRWAEAVRAQLSLPGAPFLTFFEASMLMAVLAFRAHEVDVAILEVGLGGRFDATNAIETSAITVITSIALDHQQYLGDDRASIVREKLGIARPGTPLVTGVRPDDEVFAVMETTLAALEAPLLALDRDIACEESGGVLDVRVGSRWVRGLQPRLEGPHQRDNVAVAIAVLATLGHGLGVDDVAMRAAVADVTWPGRLERVPGSPRFVFDAAHNPHGAAALASALAAGDRPTGAGRRVLLFGAMADKDWPAMLASLAPVMDDIVYVAPALARAATPETFAAVRTGHVASSLDEGLALARSLAGDGGEIVVCGSIFVLAEIRARVLGIAHEPPIPF